MRDESPSVLELSHVSVTIAGRDATSYPVEDVSLSIGFGETLGLVGESGSGKTMTALAVLRLLPQGSSLDGEITLAGRPLTSLIETAMRQVRGKEIGIIFQDPLTSLNPTMTIGRQVAQPLLLHERITRSAAKKRVAEMLGLVGLPRALERLDFYPHQLSGGMRQRVMIALALICQPRLLIADEPTTALDVTIQAQILELLDKLKEQLRMAMLLVTHDMGVIANHADRVAVMYAGRIVEEAPREELFSSPRHRYTHALFQAIPRLEQGRQQQLKPIPGLPPDVTQPQTGCRFAPRCAHVTEECTASKPSLIGDGHRHACIHPFEGGGLSGFVTTVDRSPEHASGGGSTMVRLLNVHREFPAKGGFRGGRETVKAVSGITLEISRGETFGLVGESGSGKTTVGRLIVGLDKPTAGVIQLGDAARRAVRAQFVFQDLYSSLDPRMRIGSTIREPLAIARGVSRADQEVRVGNILREVGLSSEFVSRYPHEFSGGQRQRIGLARALVVDPEVVVADEPVSALDVSVQAQLLTLMRRLQEERDLTMIIISHDLSVVKYLSDRIGIMYLGKLVEIGPSERIYAQPAHPYTEGLLAAIPVPEPHSSPRSASLTRGELPSALNPPSGCRFRTRCPRAQPICAEVEPPLRLFGERHEAACHFPSIEAVKEGLPSTPTRLTDSRSDPDRHPTP